MSTFKAINHSEPSNPNHSGGGPINISLAADIRPIVTQLDRIALALEALCLNCDSEGIIDAIAMVQLRVDVPEISPKIEVQPAVVNVTVPEMTPTINLTAPEGSSPIVSAPVVNVIFPYWILSLIIVAPAIIFALLYLLRSHL